ncbi:MAG: hypothetical protein LPH19_12845, partial [Shewanella sp.]|nr:hypothetical protein [Shewanella sp.]
MPGSLLVHPPLVFTRHDNMEVILRGDTYTTNPKEGVIRRNGKYIGQVKQGSADKGEVFLNLSLLDNNYLRVNYIGDPKSAIVNIGVGSLLMYTAVLTARLNFASYILVGTPLTSA